MKKTELLRRLERFLKLARQHANFYEVSLVRTSQQIRANLRDQEVELNRQYGILQPFILKVSTTEFYSIEGKHINPWRSAFIPGPPVIKGQSLNLVIGDLSRIIGHYERLEQEEVRPKDVNFLFDSLNLHHKVVEVSERLFKDGYYAQAILDAFKEVNIAVQDVSGINDRDGNPLMEHVFSLERPLIKLTPLKSRTQKDEQLGFKFLFSGATIGIRNPKAHTNIKQNDPYKTLEYLSLASLLLKRLDERID